MGYYQTTFILALLLVAIAVACAFIPEIRDFVGRRRKSREERHVIRPEKDDPAPRPPRPTLKREEERDQP